MTKNQIDYMSYKEQVRHNQMVEQETGRHNVITEAQTDRAQVETSRHNRVTEDLGYQNLFEVARHNRETENLGYLNYGELRRHNLSTESVAQAGIGLQAREVAVKERGQALNEWSARYIPIDVETRRIQAQASTTSASAALQQAGVAAALLPYNQQKLTADTMYSRAKANTEVANYWNVEADTELKKASEAAKRSEANRSKAQARLAEDQAYHQEWLNQSGNLFLEQGTKLFDTFGGLLRYAK